METKRLGNSDLQITPVGIGAWAIGGADWAFGWSAQDDRESIRAIHAALDCGINWIDTAAVYGLGHSEEVVARALREYGGAKPYVFTKCERAWDANRQIVKSLKRDSIRSECEASLLRLGVDQIDLYQIHWPEPIEDIEEGWGTLVDLQREGKVRWIGLSNFNASQMEAVRKLGAITSLQPPYSLIRREVEAETLPYVQNLGIGVIAYSPMGSGMLTGAMTRERVENFPEDDWRKRSVHFQEPLLSRNLQIASRVVQVASRLGVSPGAVAISWVLHNPAVTGAIVGIRSSGQVEELASGFGLKLTQDDYEFLASE
ncbi:MAG: ral stress protein 69 [Planctomycetota bacterium]|jgi:aryl-alcohol dehydrogenase-like predicted oxidoreductase